MYYDSKMQLSFGNLKFRKKSWLIRTFSICLFVYCFYVISRSFKLNIAIDRDLLNIDPVYISRVLSSLKYKQTVTSGFTNTPLYSDTEFDPNLPSLRKRILRVLNDTSFSTPFTNHEALYSNNELNFDSLTHRGSLNVYVWRDHCSQSIDLLKAKLGFPFNPWKKYLTYSLTLLHQYEYFGQRVFGYIVPPVSGRYSLEVTFAGSIEIWLSPDTQPSHAVKLPLSPLASSHYIARLLRRIVLGAVEQVTYVVTSLVANKKQYIEILHASSDKCVLEMKWKRPGNYKYQPIEPKYIWPYVNDFGPKVIPETYAPLSLPSHEPSPDIQQYYHPYDERDSVYSLPTVDISALGGGDNWAIPLCEYRPSYVEKSSIRNAYDLELVSTQPATGIYSIIVQPKISNAVISLADKEIVMRLFMYHLAFSHPNARLSRFINMERLSDPVNGDLYLIEALVTVDELKKRELLLSEYVVLGHISFPRLILCQPTALRMHRSTFVHFLVTHRNFPHMLREFVQNMERIYADTGDDNFGVIIVDYESPAISVTSLLRQSKLKHWSLIVMDGPWEKSAAINLGIDSVSSPDDIIFITDLSLHIPSYLPDSIRKHTFRGYSGFAPVVFYFACKFGVRSFYKGFYSLTGFGLVSLYKSDWQKVGGMDTTRFKGKWGLEDNDLANRILASGYVLFRLVMRDFYHQNHTYAGLWNVDD